MPSIGERLKNGWNAFFDSDAAYKSQYRDLGLSSTIKPDRPRLFYGNEKTIINSIYTRIAIDVAAVDIEHIRLDEEGRFKEEIDSGLNNALKLDANVDQTGRYFRQDLVMTMLDEGCVAIVPTDTSVNPRLSNSYDIYSMRVGRILEWYPSHVKVRVYNERKGVKEDLVLPKKMLAIIENPLYPVMNEPNSTLKRLIRKLSLLDYVDEQKGAGKLDLIIQLPYVIKTDTRRQEAEKRRKDIELQLSGSKYGIAYTDGTERITQLNRPIDNTLQTQVESLTSMLYSQLGITDKVMNGTATEEEMINYYNRTIEPILSAIVDEMKRKFLTKTARSQGQSIQYFKDPFKMITIANIAEIGDTFTRNEIMSPNEIRGILGLKPSNQEDSDELRNRNLNPPDGGDVTVSNEMSGEPERSPMDTPISEIMN